MSILQANVVITLCINITKLALNKLAQVHTYSIMDLSVSQVPKYLSRVLSWFFGQTEFHVALGTVLLVSELASWDLSRVYVYNFLISVQIQTEDKLAYYLEKNVITIITINNNTDCQSWSERCQSFFILQQFFQQPHQVLILFFFFFWYKKIQLLKN